MSTEEIKAAVRAAIAETLDDIFDKEMLAKMEKHGIIAQGLGFVTHCRVDLYTAVETALGIEEEELKAMNKCSCKQPERIGVHLPTCNVFKGLTFENSKKECVCRTGEDLANFLKSLPLSHMAFILSSTYSEDVESGYLSVEVDPSAKTIVLVGSASDV